MNLTKGRHWTWVWHDERLSLGVEWDPEYLGLSTGLTWSPWTRFNPRAGYLRFHLGLGPLSLTAYVEVGSRREGSR